ncbi:DUF4148 domain-containing protein [Caballeronia grimmiae]|uniref:DUF4148 domain-containing protein n=1 Tax=Caballeronia grimmiae TaxID=1071679 RepID=UPI0038BC2A98
MKHATIVVAAALAIPAVSSFPQSQPSTRAQLKAEFVQLERARYNPSVDRVAYPAQIQAAEARSPLRTAKTAMAASLTPHRHPAPAVEVHYFR